MAVRVKELVQRLVLPLHVGETVLEKFTLADATLAAEESRVIYTFAPSDLKVAIEPRSTRPSCAQTPSFNVFRLSTDASQLSGDESRLLDHVVSLIRANDPGGVVWESAPTLFLVPGIICNRYDLSLRAIDVLRRVAVVLVEPGKESFTAELLALHGVDAAGKRILPLPEDVHEVVQLVDDLVARDEDACLFGADEGLPGFNDPGKSLLEAASAVGDRLRVRTVGGPSALAMALLRIPINLDRFLFLGIHGDSAGLVERLMRQGNDVPLVLFLGDKGEAVARRIAALCLPLGAEVFVACDLTCETEQVFHLRPGDSLDVLPTLDAMTRMVLVVDPPPAVQLNETSTKSER